MMRGPVRERRQTEQAMIAICAKCGLRSGIKLNPAIRGGSTLETPASVMNCPFLKEALKQKGQLEGEDAQCPHQTAAWAAALGFRP